MRDWTVAVAQCSKPDVWLRGANIETGGGREGGENVSVNGILQPNACEI